jgi:hypothetical protein
MRWVISGHESLEKFYVCYELENSTYPLSYNGSGLKNDTLYYQNSCMVMTIDSRDNARAYILIAKRNSRETDESARERYRPLEFYSILPR